MEQLHQPSLSVEKEGHLFHRIGINQKTNFTTVQYLDYLTTFNLVLKHRGFCTSVVQQFTKLAKFGSKPSPFQKDLQEDSERKAEEK